jgi:DNA-binding IclR family transcriptional regulator
LSVRFERHARPNDALALVRACGAKHKRESLLARIDEARERGYSSSGAVIPGVGAIAAPVFDRTGTSAATVAIVASLETLHGPNLEAMAGSRRATAAAVSRHLGFTGRETAGFALKASR